MQLEGTLDKFPLRELIEMIMYSSVTGVLEVGAGSQIGQVFFSDGRPYHAAVGERVGVEALGVLFEQRDALFRFVADKATAESTLWTDPWDLLDQGSDLASKWLRVRQFVPTLEHVPQLSGAPVQGQIHINETVWPVLSAIDGHRSVQEISAFLNLVMLDTCLALMALVEQGLVLIQPPHFAPHPTLVTPPARAGEPPLRLPPTPADATGGSGFLERLLAEARAKEQQRPDLTDEQAQERKQVYRYVDDRR
ncbi:MAG TPA: DUF4388 domain-containing protein [Kouleothrix sp.]|uniref:DUF4388 domain-containing protein n=1 Tax=Kouleothrix sp. TaxID=2779161 RepID=UPI002CBD85A8|nr:DUF4388 domain-containing protein [Kouleothrix sp.]